MKNLIKINTIILDKDKCGEKFAETLGNQLLILMEQDNVCKVKYDDCDLYIIEHENDEEVEYLGGPRLMWLTEDEADLIESKRQESEEEEKDD
jgi:hypothetical protein